MHKFFSVVTLCLLSQCILPTQSTICWVDPSDDFHDRMPLVLKANADEFIYPNKCGSKTLRLTFQDNLRAACPGDSINVFGSNTNLAEAKMSCYGITLFGLSGTSYAGPFRQIRCNRIPEAEVQMTTATCNNGTGTISKIGFQVSSSSFVPTIEEVCLDVNQTHWTHHKVVPGLTRRTKLPGLGGGLWGGNGWGSWLGSTSTTTQSTTTAADNQVIDTLLVPREDMFYRAQQDSTFSTINTVPMYKSVRDGNWRLIEDIVRKIANTKKQCATLDVWTGRYNGTNTTSSDPTTTTTTTAEPTSTTVTSSTTDASTSTTTMASTSTTTDASTSTTTMASTSSSTVASTSTTTAASNSSTTVGTRSSRQLQPRATTIPRFLFKMVVDKTRNRGIVFVTLNDPTATAITSNEQLCTPYAQCNNVYPQFNVVSRGYTHCCTLDTFANIAKELGLPTFANAQPLI